MTLGDLLSCVPLSCSDFCGYLDSLREIFNYIIWLVSTGYNFDTRATTAKLFRYYLGIFFLIEVTVLFLHLENGVVDMAAFTLGSTELLVCTVTLALQTGRGQIPRALTVSVWLGCLCLCLDLVSLAYFLAAGHDDALVQADFVAKLSAYVVFTSLPFYAMDQDLSAAKSSLVFVWKLWVIEAVDFSTISFGLLKYAEEMRDEKHEHESVSVRRHLFGWFTDDTPPASVGDDGWGGGSANGYTWPDWNFTMRVYFVAFAANALFFGGLSAVLLTATFTSKTPWVLGDGHYRAVAAFVTALDTATDLPVWVASLASRAYIGNPFLTFNVVVNLLACSRGVYITLTAFLHDGDSESLEPGRNIQAGDTQTELMPSGSGSGPLYPYGSIATSEADDSGRAEVAAEVKAGGDGTV